MRTRPCVRWATVEQARLAVFFWIACYSHRRHGSALLVVGVAGGPSAPPSFWLAAAWAASSAASACAARASAARGAPARPRAPRSGPAGRPARPRGPRRPGCAATPRAGAQPLAGRGRVQPLGGHQRPLGLLHPHPSGQRLGQLGHLGVPGVQRHAGCHQLGDHPGVGTPPQPHQSPTRDTTRWHTPTAPLPTGRQPPPGRQAPRAALVGLRPRPAGQAPVGGQVHDHHGHPRRHRRPGLVPPSSRWVSSSSPGAVGDHHPA